MTLTDKARQHNAAAFDAELKIAAQVRRLHHDHNGAREIERAIITSGTNEWTEGVARRFVHVIS